jgi:hypothetical protein
MKILSDLQNNRFHTSADKDTLGSFSEERSEFVEVDVCQLIT